MKKIVFNATDEHYTKILKLMKEKGYFTVSEAMRFMIGEAIGRHIDDYKSIYRNKMSAKLSPKDKVLANLEADKVRADARKQETYLERQALCEVLGGTENMDEGYPVCIFTKFVELPGTRGIEEHETKIPYENLTTEQVELQYTDMFGNTGAGIKHKLTNK